MTETHSGLLVCTLCCATLGPGELMEGGACPNCGETERIEKAPR